MSDNNKNNSYKDSAWYSEQKSRQKKKYKTEILTDKGYVKHMLIRAKRRAKIKGIDFDLSQEDIQIPDRCPILDIKLEYGEYTENKRGGKYNSPSLDRIDNDKGYVKGNIRIISNKANTLKSDLTIEQVDRMYKYMKGDTE